MQSQEEKEALHKLRHFIVAAAAPKFGLLSPDKTGFCCVSINFLQKSTVKTEPTVRCRKPTILSEPFLVKCINGKERALLAG